ncbi:MAG: hypothetical protein AB1715_07545, partial [Acidobacteriota bacterium]
MRSTYYSIKVLGEESQPEPSENIPESISSPKIIAFLTDYAVVDRIINHLKLTFVAERPPPPRLAY